MDWEDWAVGTIKVSSAGGVSRMGRVDSVSGVIGWHEQGESVRSETGRVQVR